MPCKVTISEFEFLSIFDTEEKAVAYFESLRWPDSPQCPYCNSKDVYPLPKRQFYRRCKECNKQFTCKVGSVMQSSPLKIRTWLYTMYKISVARKGISSLQLSKELGITQKSAWFMLQRIKEVCGNAGVKLNGIIEVDETYIGGKEDNKHANKKSKAGRGAVGKQAVLGMRERGGRTKAMPVNNTGAKTLQHAIEDHVEKGSQIYTDDHRSYQTLSELNYDHQAVKHSAKEYVNGLAHTNGIESVWAVLKRSIIGTYHHVSFKHLGRYVNEATFRLNDGNVERHLMDRISAICVNTVGCRITYKDLKNG